MNASVSRAVHCSRGCVLGECVYALAWHNYDRVRRCTLACNKVACRLARDAGALANGERVQPRVAPNDTAARVDKIARAPVNVLVKEACKRVCACTALTDKAEAHTLAFLSRGQAKLPRQGAHVGLVERAKGEQGVGEARRRHRREVV